MRWIYFVIAAQFVLLACSKAPKSAVVFGSDQVVPWQDTISYVLPKSVEFKNEQVYKNELFGIETSNNSTVGEDESAKDIMDALGSSIESLIRTAGHVPNATKSGKNGVVLIVNSFSCKNSYEYTQQLVYTQGGYGANDDGSSYKHKEKCEIILSQSVDGKMVTKKMYLWDQDALESLDYVEKVLTDFTQLKAQQ